MAKPETATDRASEPDSAGGPPRFAVYLPQVGVLMLTGYLFSFGTWMLNTFPVFQEIQL